jgi:long-chain acyl-CoA synthetase
MFVGYYKQPELTATTKTTDGWVKTGDVVQIMPGRNSFKIIDRVKVNYKSQTGLYIAPLKV